MGVLAAAGVPVVVVVLTSVGVHGTMALLVGLVQLVVVDVLVAVGVLRAVAVLVVVSEFIVLCILVPMGVVIIIDILVVVNVRVMASVLGVADLLVAVCGLLPVDTLGAKDLGSQSGVWFSWRKSYRWRGSRRFAQTIHRTFRLYPLSR